MADNIYSAGDLQGYDFAFDAVGKFVDLSAVEARAERRDVRLTVDLAMLMTTEQEDEEAGDIGFNAKGKLTIPQGTSALDIRRRLYAAIRGYIRTVGNKLGLPADRTPSGMVALLASIEAD